MLRTKSDKSVELLQFSSWLLTKLLKIDSSQKIVAKYKISQILICIFWQNILRLLQNKTSLWEIFSPKLKIQFDTAQGKSAENYNNILWNIFCETFNWKIVMYQCWIEINFFNLLSYKKVQTVLYVVTCSNTYKRHISFHSWLFSQTCV